MPVYLRQFYLKLLIRRNEEEQRQYDKARGVSEASPVSKKEMSKVPGFVKNQVSAK